MNKFIPLFIILAILNLVYSEEKKAVGPLIGTAAERFALFKQKRTKAIESLPGLNNKPEELAAAEKERTPRERPERPEEENEAVEPREGGRPRGGGRNRLRGGRNGDREQRGGGRERERGPREDEPEDNHQVISKIFFFCFDVLPLFVGCISSHHLSIQYHEFT